MFPEFMKCRKPDCMRKVPPSVAYCCHACSTAAECGYELEPYSPALHWILCHSDGCEARSAERGECSPLEADILEQR